MSNVFFAGGIKILQDFGVDIQGYHFRMAGISTGTAYTYAAAKKVRWQIRCGKLSGRIEQTAPPIKSLHPAICESVEQLQPITKATRLASFPTDEYWPKYLELVVAVNDEGEAFVLALDLEDPFAPLFSRPAALTTDFHIGTVVIFDQEYFASHARRIAAAFDANRTYIFMQNEKEVWVIVPGMGKEAVLIELKFEYVAAKNLVEFDQSCHLVQVK